MGSDKILDWQNAWEESKSHERMKREERERKRVT